MKLFIPFDIYLILVQELPECSKARQTINIHKALFPFSVVHVSFYCLQAPVLGIFIILQIPVLLILFPEKRTLETHPKRILGLCLSLHVYPIRQDVFHDPFEGSAPSQETPYICSRIRI